MTKKQKTIAKLNFAIIFAGVSVSPIFAYLDPGTTTYLIQIVAGAAITIATVAGIYWHKIKKAVKGKKDDSVKATTTNPAEEGKTFSAEDIMKMSEEEK